MRAVIIATVKRRRWSRTPVDLVHSDCK